MYRYRLTATGQNAEYPHWIYPITTYIYFHTSKPSPKDKQRIQSSAKLKLDYMYENWRDMRIGFDSARVVYGSPPFFPLP